MKQRCFVSLWMACLLFSAASVQAGYEIFFQSGTVEPADYEFRLNDQLEGQHAILQFFTPLSNADKEVLKASGVEILGYLPERAFAVKLRHSLSSKELTTLGVRAALPFAPEYKLHPRVMNSDFGKWSEYENGQRMFNVDIFSDVTLESAAKQLELSGFVVGDHIEIIHTLVVAADPGKITELAALDFVQFVNEVSPPLESLNATVRVRLHVNEVQAEPYNLSGAGVTIMVYDGGMVDDTHPDFSGRVTALEAGTVAAHPTHVAGTVGGDGTNSAGNNRGMAPEATIISGEYDICTPFCFYNSPADVSEDYILARETYGIELTTNSMGANVSPNFYPCSWFGDYELTSRILDGMVKNTVDRPLPMFWAAGNERGDPGCANNSYRCMSIPASAKNIVTVGATTSADALASFSSFGPTDDGRIKPEVVAMGVNVNSCAPGGGYAVMSGTSMSTPATAGVACLILERWHTLYPGAPDPLPEALKALMINSANDLGNTGPDFQSGFGLVNAQRAIDHLQAGGVVQGSLDVGATYERTFTVAANTPALEVSLAWTDVPALGNVIPTLVNDLNLLLIDPIGAAHETWVLNPSSPGSAAILGRDSVNVCEKARVTSPMAGEWTIRVSGEINIGESQTFGLASNVALVTEWTTITGTIYESTNPDDGLPGIVYVDELSISALTTQDGEYTVVVPRGAVYEVRARAYGLHTLAIDVDANSASVTQDFAMLDITETSTIVGAVVNQLGDLIEGAIISYYFPNEPIEDDTSDANGGFIKTLLGGQFVVSATFDGLSTSQIVDLPIGQAWGVTLEILDSRMSPFGPDAAGYYCYESADTGYAPTYEYTSIAPAAGGPGTLIGPGAGNDWSLTIPLPFNARFYGVLTGGLEVGADGWIGFGDVAQGTNPYRNGPIPYNDAATPNNSVYIFWDDLNPYSATQGGQIAYYHDVANDRFIVEYYQVPHFTPDSLKLTAQFILYSQNSRPTTTGDSEFEVHYERFESDIGGTDPDATIGIENSNGSIGLLVYYNDLPSNPNQYPIAAPYSLRYTTGPVLGTGTLTGQITALPATDLSTATLRVGALAFSPEADGSFSIGNISAGTFRLEFELNGYENLLSEQFTIPIGGTVNVDMTVYRLDAPQNLAGEFDAGANVIRLNWQRPTWGGALRDGGADRLDALADYTVIVAGRPSVTGIADTFLVYTPPAQGIYRFWVVANYDGGISDSSNMLQFVVSDADDAPNLVPTVLYLDQNYPNPFNPTTTLSFGLPAESQVTLEIFDITGRSVARLLDSRIPAGHHNVSFDATGLGSGVYFYRLNTEQNQLIRKMMLLR